MQYLFDAWNKVGLRLKSAHHVLLLSDYDGTLTTIVEKPELAVLSAETRNLLRRLSKNRHYTVGIISGRALTDLRDRVNVDGIIYAGNHGLEIEGLGSDFLEPLAEEMRPMLHILNRVLSVAMRGIKGVFVEDKGLTLSVHYRLAEGSEIDKVENTFTRITDSLNVTGQIKITRGKKVYEIRPPVDWNKGKAISLLMLRLKQMKGKAGALPVYLGDDLTDEDGFKVIEQNKGISVFVGEEEIQTAARYFLKSPHEVTELLRML
jgi:trehalose 6-phosphate phosphatase